MRYNRRIFYNSWKYRIYVSRNMIYAYITLFFMGICLGLASMYFGSAYYLMPMFQSYFKVEFLPFLNIFPVLICIYLLYFIFNRVWVSFLITSILTMGLTWINYFKLIFRNDPLLATDLSLLFESLDMISKYDIRLNWKMNYVIAACFLGTLAAAFLVKGKIRSNRFRLAGIVSLVLVGIFSYQNIYMDGKYYSETENYSLINRWASTQVFISRGFIYPFIYSSKASNDVPPEGYDKEAALERLSSFDYSDIPDDKKVHVISVMLEAYNDFSKFKQLSFNIDVYKYLHQLQKEAYSGELVTNIFAGGTVDTERCFLTGYTSLFNFRRNINSYVRYFKEQGYTVEGSHPSYGWFYNRENVNEYLGFENYFFFENHYSKLAKGIARDEVLFPQIIEFYEAHRKTKKPYFSFNVTYQNHGPYSSEKLSNIEFVKNKGYTDAEYNTLNNYFAGIYSTNQSLQNFIEHFRAEDEPVVIILFGDHNPWMGDNNSIYKMLGINFDLGTEDGFYNYYNTPYVIWGNDSAKKILGNTLKGKGPDIGPYFLMNEFFKLAGYEGNEFMKLSNEMKEILDVIHSKARYKEAGILTARPSAQAEKKLQDFLQVQYYWRNNYSNRNDFQGLRDKSWVLNLSKQ